MNRSGVLTLRRGVEKKARGAGLCVCLVEILGTPEVGFELSPKLRVLSVRSPQDFTDVERSTHARG